MKESLKPIEPGCLAMVVKAPNPQRNHIGMVGIYQPLPYNFNGACPACGRRDTASTLDCDGRILMGCSDGLIRIDPDDEIRVEEEHANAANELERTLRKAGVWEG